MLRNHLVRMPLSHGPEASFPDTTRQGDRIREPATPTRDTYLRPKSQSKQYIILRRSHGQVTKVPGWAPHITTEQSADSRHRTPRARVCLHIQKPKPQASTKNKIDKFHKLFDVYGIQIHYHLTKVSDRINMWNLILEGVLFLWFFNFYQLITTYCTGKKMLKQLHNFWA